MNRVMIAVLALLGAASPLLLDSALKGAGLLVVAGLAASALYRASAATRHLIWVFAVGALFVLPVLSALLPGWRALPRWAAAPARAISSGQAAVPPVALRGHSPVPSPMISRSAARPEVEPALSRDVRDWLPVAWAAGCSLLFVRLLAAYWLLARATRRCAVARDGRLAEMLEAARRRLGIRQQVQVGLDARRTIPMIWGVWRPRLLLPAQALEWDDGQLHSVLLHELAHVKRHDLAVQCLLQAACALHWFNPLVWLAAWRLQAEGERACDDLVLASGVRASEYAEHVLRVATQFAAARAPRPAGLAMARPSRLEGRLVAVLNERLNRRGLTRTLTWLALAAGLCVVVPVAMLRAAEDKAPGRGAAESSAAPQQVMAPSSAVGGLTVEIASDGSLTLDGKAVTLDALRKGLALRQQTNPAVKVTIHASTDAAWARVVKVIDALNASAISLEAQAEVLRARLQKANRDLERAAKLRQQNLISESDYVKAQYEVASFQAELNGNRAEAARIRLQQAESELKRLTQLGAEKAVPAEQVEQARLNVQRLRAEATSDPAERARAEVESAKALLAFAQNNFKRISEMSDQKLVSEEERDRAEEEVAEARLRLVQARSRQPGVATNAAGVVAPNQDERNQGPSGRQKRERVLHLLADEIQVAEGLAKVTRRQYESGNTTFDTYQHAEIDVLALKRERAGLEGDTAQTKELIGQQIRLLQELEQVARQRRAVGTGSEADELRVRRQLLSLQRQQAELE
ncbi:MAG: M56 family metallopeptidase [Limisphaerales bacterium]